MNHTLFAAVRELWNAPNEMVRAADRRTRTSSTTLLVTLGAYLPDWYRSLLATVPLIGLELGVVASELEVDDEISWLEWLDPGRFKSWTKNSKRQANKILRPKSCHSRPTTTCTSYVQERERR